MKNTSEKYWRILLVFKMLFKEFNDIDTIDYGYKTLVFKSGFEISLYYMNSNYMYIFQVNLENA